MISTLPLVAAFWLALAPNGEAFWRMECRSRSGIGQIDPLMSFGTPSSHTHIIHGGQNFGFDASAASLNQSSCTSCAVTQDKSAYWTPPMMFMAEDQTTTMVEPAGGMLAYYLLNGKDIKAFPSGFQMISGDNTRRNFSLQTPDPPKSNWGPADTTQDALAQKAIGFNCLDYSKAPEGSLMRHELPDKAFLDANCPDGLRLELMFPSCWNGKDVDSPDHKSHVAFPNQVMTGDCPPDYPVRLPSLFYETIFQTNQFKGQSGQFVISNGDPGGHGYHGDFIAAWEGDESFLQSAVDTCTNPSGKIQDCQLFNVDYDKASQCTFNQPSQIANVDYTGPRKGLPGDLAIQSGPQPASCGDSNVPTPSPSSPAASPPAVPTQNALPASSQSPSPPSSSPVPGVFASITASSAAPDSSSTAAGSPISTSTYTTNGMVVNEIIMQEEVTVTQTTVATTTEIGTEPTAPAAQKRAEHIAHFLKHRQSRMRRGHGHGWY
ncbi:MAG: hypothetical protein Q9227_004058 [Pyrenula ochraceoflavens]